MDLAPQIALIHCHPGSKDDADAIFIDVDSRVQVLETMMLLPHADKEQCAAFIVSFYHPTPGVAPHN